MGAVVVFQQMLVIFLLILVGYVLFKKGILTESASRAVSAVVVNITNPALLISSALDGGAAVTHREVLAMACVSAGVYAALLTLGALLPRVFRAGSSERKFYNVMAVYANTGFIGIPLVSELLGSEGMIYLVVFNLFFNFLFYTHGRHVLSAGLKDKRQRLTWRTFVNVGTVSGAVALLLFWFQAELPTVIQSTLDYAGRSTTFLSMLVLGVSLARMPLRSIFSDMRLNFYSLLRMLVLPILAALVLREAAPDPVMASVASILVAVPAGNLPLMTAQEYGIEAGCLARGIVLTTLMGIVTIPVTAAFMPLRA